MASDVPKGEGHGCWNGWCQSPNISLMLVMTLMYSMQSIATQDKRPSKLFVTVRLALEWLQLLLIFVKPEYEGGWICP